MYKATLIWIWIWANGLRRPSSALNERWYNILIFNCLLFLDENKTKEINRIFLLLTEI